jgi:hypothetical protein
MKESALYLVIQKKKGGEEIVPLSTINKNL